MTDVVLDDRDPQAQAARRTVLDLATTYGAGREIYQQEFTRIWNTALQEREQQLGHLIHAGVLMVYVGLSAIAESERVDFNDAAMVMENAVNRLIEQSS